MLRSLFSEVKNKRAASGKFNAKGFSLDKAFQGLLVFVSCILLLVLFAIIVELVHSSWPSLKTSGLGLFEKAPGQSSFFHWKMLEWNPNGEKYGALAFIYGTITSSLIAMMIAVPISLGSALFITQWAPSWMRNPISFLIELLAAIPSVIYGLWAIFILIPFIRTTLFPAFSPLLGSFKLFEGPAYGPSLLAGGMILSIMILPTITSVTKEIFLTIPQELKEGVYALGGTQWEAINWVVLKLSRSGIIGACVLGLGRAIGETMAVTMVIGNRPEISASIFAPAYSLASVIANEFAEATSPLYLSALSKMGLLLLVITLIVNTLARLLVGKAKKR